MLGTINGTRPIRDAIFRERSARCDEHAVEEQRYWSAVDWDTGVEVSDIEEWKLGHALAGR